MLSVSAVGEQYVDLRPRTDSGPYLQDGSRDRRGQHHDPAAGRPDAGSGQHAGGQHSRATGSPTCSTRHSRRSTARGPTSARCIDSGATLTEQLNSVSDQSRGLIDDSGPLLDSQAETTDSIRTWARSLARRHRATRAERSADARPPATRTRLRAGGFGAAEPGEADAAGAAGQPHHAGADPGHVQPVARATPGRASPRVVGSAGLRSCRRTTPPACPSATSRSPSSDPPPCTVGFLPPSQWRSPADTTTIDTPDGLYCKLPQDSPIAVRGARNYPCMGHPGKRAPTVELCNDPEGFKPMAHAPARARAVPVRPEPDRAGHSASMTGSTSRTGSTRRSRARPCRRAPCRRERPPVLRSAAIR